MDTNLQNIEEVNIPALQHQSPIRKWAGLGVLTLGLAIIIIDTTLLNVSLSNIIKDLKTDLQGIQWVISLYALVLAAFTITGGRLGDLFGRRKMFMLGAIIFAVGSFLASVSHSVPVLLLGESIIEGIGAALMMPATASLVVANFSGKERAMAFGIWGGVAGASSAIGPLLGGFLTTHYTWRWGFRINIFVAAAVIVGSLFLIQESKDERKPKLDWLGVVLSSLGLLAISFGIIESSSLGWWKAKQVFSLLGHSISFGNFSIVPFTLAWGLVILAAFVWWEWKMEKEGKSPLVSMKMMQNRQFTSGVATISILSLGMTGMMFALPVFLQAVKHLDAFHTGLAMLPISLAILVMAPIVGNLSKRIEPRNFIRAGLLIDVVAALILRATITADVSLSNLIFGLALYGLGMSFVFAPITNLILSAVPVEQSGEASGVNNTLRQVGATLGAAIIGAAVLTSLSGHLSKAIENSQAIAPAAKQQIISKIAGPNSNVEFGASDQLTKNLPPIMEKEIHQLVNEAATRSTKDAYVYTALFAFIGFIIAMFIPKMHTAHDLAYAEEKEKIPKYAFGLAALAVALAATASFWMLQKSAKAVINTGLVDASQIRGAFIEQPLAGGEASPKPSDVIVVPADTDKPAVKTPAPKTPATPQLKTYSNSALAFSIQIPTTWQTSPSENLVSFVGPKGSNNVTIQVFNANSQTLDQTYIQLKNSPTVIKITRSTFKGEPSLNFTTGTNEGIALIHNGKIYYIMAENVSLSPVLSFVF